MGGREVQVVFHVHTPACTYIIHIHIHTCMNTQCMHMAEMHDDTHICTRTHASTHTHTLFHAWLPFPLL